MQNEPQGQRELERDWRERWLKAKADLDAARARVASLKPAGGPDGNYAYARAVMDETDALAEYSRVLRLYADLVVHGKLPTAKDPASDGLIVMCRHCQRTLRHTSEGEDWVLVEAHLLKRPKHVTDGLCGDCLEKHYPRRTDAP